MTIKNAAHTKSQSSNNRRIVGATAAICFLVANVAACTDDDNKSNEPDVNNEETRDPAAGQHLVDGCKASAEIHCERLFSCPEGASELTETQSFFDFDDMAGCMDSVGTMLIGICEVAKTSVDAGYAAFDSDKFDACNAQIDVMTCAAYFEKEGGTDQPVRIGGECEGQPFLEPLQNEGDPCFNTGDCKDSKGECSASEPMLGEAPVVGVCEASDGSCEFAFDCDEDQWCDYPGVDMDGVDPDQWPVTGQCADLLAVDERCESFDACGPGLYCGVLFGDNGTRVPSECRPEVGRGEPCEYGEECADGLNCNDNQCS